MLDTMLDFTFRSAAQTAREDGFHNLADALAELHEVLMKTEFVDLLGCKCNRCTSFGNDEG